MESPVPLINDSTMNEHELDVNIIDSISDNDSANDSANDNVPSPPEWNIKPSPRALATVNPIRVIVEGLNLTPNKEKPFIPLSIGDPAVFGRFKPSDETIDAMVEVVKSCSFNGYQPAAGREEARKAVARYCGSYGMDVTSKDVILASGCSHALDMAMSILATPGCNMLVPRPGFPLYKTLSAVLGVEIRYYNLLPERDWEIDLADLESKINSKTAAIIYNNPSNPCGSVFARQHVLDVLAVAERHRVPIIGDEIYENLVFPGHEFHAIASLTEEVPVLHCSGTTKKFLMPGWRMGWIVINDKKNRFGDDVRKGLNSLSQRIIGPNSLVQGALPYILHNTPMAFFEDTIAYLHNNASMAYTRLRDIRGLTPIKPGGAFYIMVRIDVWKFPDFHDDLHFVESLVAEESVFCLPGVCFEYPGYMRLALCIATDMLEEALQRIHHFCSKHYVAQP